MVDRVDEELKPQIIHAAAVYEHRLKVGNKPIYHLEGQFDLLLSGLCSSFNSIRGQGHDAAEAVLSRLFGCGRARLLDETTTEIRCNIRDNCNIYNHADLHPPDFLNLSSCDDDERHEC